MDILKKSLAGVGIVIVFVLLLGLVVKDTYEIERQVEIKASKDVVFEYAKYLKNQDNYSVWATQDSNMKKEYRGVDGTVGFVSAWDSDNEEVGKGEQEITAIYDGKRIDFELRFIKPFKATDLAYMDFQGLDTN
jgi:hypothetical protein